MQRQAAHERHAAYDWILTFEQLDKGYKQQKELSASCRSRTRHLNELNSLESFSTRAYADWGHVRLQRQIVDTLLRRGYTQSALQLARLEDLGGLVDVEIELFRELGDIEAALLRGSANEALQWCKDNAAVLRKTKVCILTT